MHSLFSLFMAVLFFASCKTSSALLTQQSLSSTFELKNKYLIENNREGLKSLAHKDVAFCHSNCWHEDITSLLKTDEEKKLDYKAIDIYEKNVTITDKTGIIRGKGKFTIFYNDKDMVIDLCFIETYVFQHDKWYFLARQSSKVP
jgi:hypothetical protein